MDTDKKPENTEAKKEEAPASAEAKAPGAESLSSTPSSGTDGKTDTPEASSGEDAADAGSEEAPAAKPNSFKQTLKRLWLYILIVLLIAVSGGIYAIVTGLNKRKTPPPPSVQSQSVTQSQLQKLAKTATNTSGQTLNIHGDAELDGQDLIKGNLNVAGSIQSGGALTIPGLTISGTGTFGDAQASSLQTADAATFAGAVTVQNGMDVSGPTTLSSATVKTLTATKLILGSNGQITVPAHLAFTGAFPYRTISFGVLGNGGSASVNGSDTNGTVSINTGNNPNPGCFITVIFLKPFTQGANILLGPIGLGAGGAQHGAGLHAYAQPIVDDTGATTAFRICTQNTPLANQAFAFSYLADGAPN